MVLRAPKSHRCLLPRVIHVVMDLFRPNMTEISAYLRESWSLGWPMIMIMFFQFSIGLADVYVAGLLGTDVLAAVGYVGQLYWTLIILANAITVGTVSMASQAYGAKSDEGVGNIGATSLALGIAISGGLTAFALWSPASIVRIAGMPQGIQDIAEAFVRIFALVLVPSYVMIITGGVLRASGRVRVTMVNSFIAAAVNIAACLGLGLGWGPFPALGYRGIAWATALATSLGMILNLVHVFHGPGSLSLGALSRPGRGCFRNLVKLGIPTAIQQTSWNVGTLIVYFLVGQAQGEGGGQLTALAAMGAGVRIEAIIFLPIFALNMAAAVFTGNRIGAGDASGARSGAKATSALSLGITLLPACLIFVLAPRISAWLTEDPAVLAEMTRYLRINMVGMPFLAVGITLSGALQGAGDTYATMRIIMTGMWLLRIPLILAAIHVLHTDAAGVWWSMAGSIIIMCGLLIRRFRGEAWTKASLDKGGKKLLWEACLGGKPSSGPEIPDR
jgi:multidrug resistance protein, MATE family